METRIKPSTKLAGTQDQEKLAWIMPTNTRMKPQKIQTRRNPRKETRMKLIIMKLAQNLGF